MEQIFVDIDNPLFDQDTLSPTMSRCGIPLCLLLKIPGENNQWCTFLMIDPITGWAPPQWQTLGTVLLCCRDRMPITKAHIINLEIILIMFWITLVVIMIKISIKR